VILRNGPLLWTLSCLTLAACQPAGPPPPTAAATAAPVDDAQARVASALENAGFTVQRTHAGLTASTTAEGFARCLPVNVRDDSGDGRNVFTEVSEQRAAATVAFRPTATGTEVTWATRYSGRYRNRVDNTWFERACEGTGQLEALLNAAVTG
jgi:hypothetical protein